ncbi:hypothetical protein GN244_ATG01172 [Phytophthora infestans]|uniref:Uncharacterized protein n=1 Tax=Phytophthora infestans TaxID=4787 RepID=A0A833T2I3_PHYIN|nr:hypothetical protein GN244_ATG01172 [Phytophthora infestans]KAF4145353.1 hypothetical protein GN958_ATG05383 [Phytophthora infestans]
MSRQRKQPNPTSHKKMAIFLYLFSKATNTVLPYGAKTQASRVLTCHRETVAGVWIKRDVPDYLLAQSHRRVNGVRNPDIAEKVVKMPFSLRQTLRSLSQAVRGPRTTIQRYLKAGCQWRRLSSVRP